MANFAVHSGTTFHVGDTVQVHYKLIEKEKVAGKAKREIKEEVRERTQIFEGIVIAIRGNQENRSFIVRRIGTGKIGVERIFPLISPWIKKISVKKTGKVRRAKLYYLREKLGREATKLKDISSMKSSAKKSRKGEVKAAKEIKAAKADSETKKS